MVQNSEITPAEYRVVQMTPMIDLTHPTLKGRNVNYSIGKQIDLYFDQMIPNGFSDIKSALFSNSAKQMYDVSHTHAGITKVLGLTRLAVILDYM